MGNTIDMPNINTHMISNLLDVHSHILPGIDDGASDIDTSLQMIKSLQAQKVDTLLFTPHFYSASDDLDTFLSKREDAYKLVMKYQSSFPNLKVLKACEVEISPMLNSNNRINELCIEETKFILLEIPLFETAVKRVLETIEHILSAYDIIPIVAHVDRYDFYYDKKTYILDELTDMGCYLQINANALLTKACLKTTLNHIKNGYISFLGSDCHNMHTRPPNLLPAYEVMIKKLGFETANMFNQRGRTILFQ